MRTLGRLVTRPALAALALAAVGAVAVHAEEAKFPNSLSSIDKTAEKDPDVLAAAAAEKEDHGKYLDSEGRPTFHVTDDGKKVDWYTYSGYRRYHAECHVCHGPDGMGSTYAPALKDSLKHISYEEFIGILAGGKQDVSASEQKVMPAFGDNKNVMCYADDLYVYLRARAAGAWGRTRPGEKEAKPEAAKKAETECMGG